MVETGPNFVELHLWSDNFVDILFSWALFVGIVVGIWLKSVNFAGLLLESDHFDDVWLKSDRNVSGYSWDQAIVLKSVGFHSGCIWSGYSLFGHSQVYIDFLLDLSLGCSRTLGEIGLEHSVIVFKGFAPNAHTEHSLNHSLWFTARWSEEFVLNGSVLMQTKLYGLYGSDLLGHSDQLCMRSPFELEHTGASVLLWWHISSPESNYEL